MAERSGKVGCILTVANLYRQHRPDMPIVFHRFWADRLRGLLSDWYDLAIADVVCTEEEYETAVRQCEREGCEALVLLPMAYTQSGIAVRPLSSTNLPLLIVSTARDISLPVDMTADHLLANQMMHGVQDLTNALRRHQVSFEVLAGHFDDPAFSTKMRDALNVALGASALRTGKVGQIGGFFSGMLDFTFSETNRAGSIPFQIEGIDPRELKNRSDAIDTEVVSGYVTDLADRFSVSDDLTEMEKEMSSRYAIAMDTLMADLDLDAVAVNFLDAIDQKLDTLPFLGAADLMAKGKGYGGEGDVISAGMGAALATAFGAATFTEFFCPDYAAGEILLSHMGECNYALAAENTPVRLVAKDFAWGDIHRPAVPVFQLRPGNVTLTSISERPGAESGSPGFQVIAVTGEVVEAEIHGNLQVPYSRFRPTTPLREFLQHYSQTGGTHHLTLCYGDRVAGLRMLSRYCGFTFLTV